MENATLQLEIHNEILKAALKETLYHLEKYEQVWGFDEARAIEKAQKALEYKFISDE